MKQKILTTLDAYFKKHKQASNDDSLKHCIEVAHHILKKSKYCFLNSQGKNGWCSSRLIEPIIERDNNGSFTIWIGTRKDLRKVEEIWENPKVSVTFENLREKANIVIYGNAFIETNPEIKRKNWKGAWKTIFLADPKSNEYIALRIEPSRIKIVNLNKNITPEPFDLKPAVLVNHQDQWKKEKV